MKRQAKKKGPNCEAPYMPGKSEFQSYRLYNVTDRLLSKEMSSKWKILSGSAEQSIWAV